MTIEQVVARSWKIDCGREVRFITECLFEQGARIVLACSCGGHDVVPAHVCEHIKALKETKP